MEAISTKPDLIETHSSLGNALTEVGYFEEALESARNARTTNSDCAEAHYNLKIVVHKPRQLSEAAES